MNITTLGEVAQISMGSAPPGKSYNEVGNGIPMIAGAGDYGEKYPKPKKWTTSPSRITEIGDLIVCVRATIGDLNWADKKYCLGRGVAGLRAKKGKLDINFAAHYINAKKIDLTKLGTGSTFLAIRRADLENFPIPLPPLVEQKRIAAILDKAERLQAIQLADEFLRSVFLDMFGDPVLNPKGWRRCRFEDVLENIDSGWSPKCLGRAANSVEWGVLKLGAVTSCQYIEHENKALPSTLKPQMESEIKKGDLLFTRKNTYELIAACAYVYETRPKLMISDTIFRFKLRKNAEIVPEYLWALLTHYGKRRQLQSLASGSAGSMPNISKARLSQQKIELPPFEMQNKFAKIFHKIRVASKKQLAHVEKSGELFNSLTQHAFVGKLKQKTDFRL